ncbi:MAG: glycosyltransferase family 9 protein [Bacteroidetes bacterium]|nr:glycosyltransferase family 9 protein [Bacteroidota bacterium]
MRESYEQLKSKKGLRVLVSRTDKIGDVILTLPLINEIKRLLPGSRITFLISRRLENLIEGYKDLDEIVYAEDFEGNTLTDLLRERKFDIAFSVFPRFELARYFSKAGIPIRAGTGYRWYSFLFNRRIKEHRKHSVKHESDYNLNLLKFLTEDISYEKKFYFSYTSSEYDEVKKILSGSGFDIESNFLIIHPGSKGSAYDLPVEKMRELSRKISGEFSDYNIVITGSKQERELADKFVETGKNIFNAAGLIGLRQLMILIDKSKLFISNSTGPIHIAGALNKNIAGFYPNSAPMNPERWRPLSDNAVIITPESGDDMSTIDTGSVMEKVRSMLVRDSLIR